MTTTPASTRLAPGVSDELDAARMRALASCPRIEMHGSAGVHPVEPGRQMPDDAGQVHFGAMLMPASASEVSTAWGRNAIVAIADDRIHVEGGRVPTLPVGTSRIEDAERFRALMRLPRIRVMSVSGGGDDHVQPVADPDRPGLFSFRAEFWSKPSGAPSAQCVPIAGRRCLIVMADDLLALAGDPAASEAAKATPAALTTPRSTTGTHGMEQTVAMLGVIRDRAQGASLSTIGVLEHQAATVEAYVKLANSLSTLPLPALRALRDARATTNAALEERRSAIVANAMRLIQAVPKDARSRSVLAPVASESELLFAIGDGAKTVDFRIREMGEAFEALLDGGPIGAVDAHAISIERDELVVEGIGRWPLDDLVATSRADGFAFLVTSGQLIEIQQSA